MCTAATTATTASSYGGAALLTLWRGSRGSRAMEASMAMDQRLLYSALIEQALSEAARKAMDMDPQIEKFFSEAHRRSYDRGKAEGEAKGKAEGEAKGKAEAKSEALLLFLRGRGIAITDDQQRQIIACTDLATLDRWLERAASVASVDELLT